MSFTPNALSAGSSNIRPSAPRARPLSLLSSFSSTSSTSVGSTRRSRTQARHFSSASLSSLPAATEPMMLSVHGRGLGGTSTPATTDSEICSKCGSSASNRRRSEPVLPLESSSSMSLLWSSMRALSLHGPSSSTLMSHEVDMSVDQTQATVSTLHGGVVRPVPKRPTQLTDLPIELLYAILSWLVPDTTISKCTWDRPPTLSSPAPCTPTPTSALLAARAANRTLSTVALTLLRPVLARDLGVLTLATSHARSHAAEVEHDAQPALAHNRRFLRTLSTSHLRELTSLSRPPAEIHQVAAALVHLIYPAPEATAAAGDWRATRRLLARPDARAWVAQVHARGPGTAEAGLAAARGIVAGMGITYDRMKAVSVPGYRMLIVVAAAIQYSEHAGRVARAVTEYERVARRLDEVGSMYAVAVRETLQAHEGSAMDIDDDSGPEIGMAFADAEDMVVEWGDGSAVAASALE